MSLEFKKFDIDFFASTLSPYSTVTVLRLVVILIFLAHKCNLIEYSTPVEYSWISKLDFYLSELFAYSILSFQNDSRRMQRQK